MIVSVFQISGLLCNHCLIQRIFLVLHLHNHELSYITVASHRIFFYKEVLEVSGFLAFHYMKVLLIQVVFLLHISEYLKLIN